MAPWAATCSSAVMLVAGLSRHKYAKALPESADQFHKACRRLLPNFSNPLRWPLSCSTRNSGQSAPPPESPRPCSFLCKPHLSHIVQQSLHHLPQRNRFR